jgi:transcriptional regulator with XRE-family HTH domain
VIFDHLGDTLTVLRLLRGLSQAETARRAGIRSNQVSRYETGQVLPQLRQLQRILDALAVDLPTLVLALDYVDRLLRLVERETTPASEMAAHSVAAWWAAVEDQHLDLCGEVARVIEDRLTATR